jgi:aspartate racemase
MEQDFITGRISKSNIEVLVPEDSSTINELHRIIQKELTFGIIDKRSKQYVVDILESMIDKGAEGVVLGCTEFPLMVSQNDLSVPIFNTTEIHSKAAADYILKLGE